MVDISNNGFITVSRGDTFSIPLFINNGSQTDMIRYYIKKYPKANIYLGVMEPNQKFEEAIIKKKFNHSSPINKYGDLVVKFESKDTEFLTPGRYFYSIKSEFIDFTHNINVEIEEIDSTLIYGWTDTQDVVTMSNVKRLVPHVSDDNMLQVLSVNNNTKEMGYLYINHNDDNEINIYNNVDDKGEPIEFIKTITIEEFLSKIKTTQNSPIVDTIIPMTEFFIID